MRRCLAPVVSERYGSAAAVHEDIERHLGQLPLAHASEPWGRERAAKWLRRHPRVGSTSTIMAVAILLIAALGSALIARGQRLAGLEATGELAEFRTAINAVRIKLGHRAGDRVERAEGQALARRLLASYHVLDDPRWARRPAVLALTADGREQLRGDVAEVLLMLAEATKRDATEQAEGPRRAELVRSAQGLNQLGMANFARGHEPQAFLILGATLVGLLGQEQEAARLAAEASKLPLRTAHDHTTSPPPSWRPGASMPGRCPSPRRRPGSTRRTSGPTSSWGPARNTSATTPTPWPASPPAPPSGPTSPRPGSIAASPSSGGPTTIRRWPTSIARPGSAPSGRLGPGRPSVAGTPARKAGVSWA